MSQADSSGKPAQRVKLCMSTQQSREKAAQMWAALQPVFIDLIADMLDAPPPRGEAEPDSLTEKDLEKIKAGVSKWRAGRS